MRKEALCETRTNVIEVQHSSFISFFENVENLEHPQVFFSFSSHHFRCLFRFHTWPRNSTQRKKSDEKQLIMKKAQKVMERLSILTISD